jgi:hypothetical protein
MQLLMVPGEATTGFRVKRKPLTRAGAPQVSNSRY